MQITQFIHEKSLRLGIIGRAGEEKHLPCSVKSCKFSVFFQGISLYAIQTRIFPWKETEIFREWCNHCSCTGTHRRRRLTSITTCSRINPKNPPLVGNNGFSDEDHGSLWGERLKYFKGDEITENCVGSVLEDSTAAPLALTQTSSHKLQLIAQGLANMLLASTAEQLFQHIWLTSSPAVQLSTDALLSQSKEANRWMPTFLADSRQVFRNFSI